MKRKREKIWMMERWLVREYSNGAYVLGPVGWAIIVLWTALLVVIAVK